jgi:hypothetical protein
MTLSRTERIRHLHELIAALDRRVPQVKRAGEASIARDAAELRGQAVQRIAELEKQDDQGRSAATSGRKRTGDGPR